MLQPGGGPAAPAVAGPRHASAQPTKPPGSPEGEYGMYKRSSLFYFYGRGGKRYKILF